MINVEQFEKEIELVKQEAFEEGIHEGKVEVATELLDIMLPELVAEQTGLPLEEVKEIKKSKCQE